ncbi:hypothetical protein, partial [uncultured Sphingomonas sp.]|uniref:hypothetical protein n=1 Tax=uncultured Sphingomonas sp. TaxID=158754 RepID=UPI0025EC35FA
WRRLDRGSGLATFIRVAAPDHGRRVASPTDDAALPRQWLGHDLSACLAQISSTTVILAEAEIQSGWLW